MASYPSDISNSQWQIISKHFDTQGSRKYDLRRIVNAILYLVKTGCQWRMLPHDFPGWKIVYYHFSTWTKSLIEHIHEVFVEKVRKQKGGNEEPAVGIFDAQFVKNTLVSREPRGFNTGKKIAGIKRYVIVDSLGLILAVVVQSACVQDRNAGIEVVEKMAECRRKIIKVFADSGYSGTLIGKIKQRYKITVETVKRTEAHIFKVLPKRWIVERRFAWQETNRRNAKYYERRNDAGVAMVQVSAILIMLNRF